MSYIADLHIHSHFSGATSPLLTLDAILRYAKVKGIDVVGSGDFTHPLWLQELENKLEFDKKTSLYKKIGEDILVLLTAEVNCIYEDMKKTRKIHLLILAPNIEIVKEINKKLKKFGILDSDGRPILLVSSEMLVKILSEISHDIEIIPAHIWTPWFGVLGKNFGYSNLEDCFKSQREHIHAIETGLSSDPFMNWLYFYPNEVTIVSFSDPHSLSHLGREATEFSGRPSYKEILQAIRDNTIASTIEFFPEEGKYHYSGHRKCGFSVDPVKEVIIGGICPVCGKKLTPGVEKRVYDLAVERKGQAAIDEIYKDVYKEPNGMISYLGNKSFYRLIPLEEIIAKTIHMKGVHAKKVQAIYADIIKMYRNELTTLLDPTKVLFKKYPEIYNNILKVKKGEVKFTPGFDNSYGDFEFNLRS